MTTSYHMRKFMNISEGILPTKLTLVERRQKLKEFLQLILPALGLLARGVSLLRASPMARTALQTAMTAAKASTRTGAGAASGGLGRLATLGGVAAVGGSLVTTFLSMFTSKLGFASLVMAAIQILPEILSHFENHGKTDEIETVKEMSSQETKVVCKRLLMQAEASEELAERCATMIIEEAFKKEKTHPTMVALATTKALIDEMRDHQNS